MQRAVHFSILCRAGITTQLLNTPVLPDGGMAKKQLNYSQLLSTIFSTVWPSSGNELPTGKMNWSVPNPELGMPSPWTF